MIDKVIPLEKLGKQGTIKVYTQTYVEELEATNKKISDECHKLVDSLEKKQKEIAELEKENAELKAEIENDRDLPTIAYMQGAEFGYNKANEWHYVKDELPDEGTYLVVWQNDKGYKEIFILKYEEDDEEELHWVDDDYEVQDEYVIAWKELPELPKESE